MDWKACEVDAYSYFVRQGYDILIPLLGSKPYDFVALKESGEAIRINVKKAHIHRYNYRINSAGGNQAPKSQRDSQQKNIDVYLVWLPDREIYIEIKADLFNKWESGVKDISTKIIKPL